MFNGSEFELAMELNGTETGPVLSALSFLESIRK